MEEIDFVVDKLTKIIAELRRISSLKETGGE
jgi:hypothetical protein